MAEDGDVFRVVELVLGGTESGVDAAGAVRGGHGNDNFTVGDILASVVHFNEDAVGVNLLADTQSGVLDGVAILYDFNASDEFQQLLFAVKLYAAVEGKVRREEEVLR